MSSVLDPRNNPYRDDLAAESLRGRVVSQHFVAGTLQQAGLPLVPLRCSPSLASEQTSELLCGESFTVYEEAAGWAWGQSVCDGYVGYAIASQLVPPTPPSNLIRDPLAVLRLAPSVKSAPVTTLSMGARVTVEGVENDYARLGNGSYVAIRQLAPLHEIESDHVATAERLLDAPYIWGGRGALGIDCSGLVQIALQRAGHHAPRDSDMLEGMGSPVPGCDLDSARRGDLVFWRGHCAIIFDSFRLIHANAQDMRVAIAPIQETVTRYCQELNLSVRALRRLTSY